MQTFVQLPEKIKTVWRLSAIGTLIFGAIVAGLLVLAQHLWRWPSWLAVAVAALTVVTIVVELAIVPYRYRFWRYAISETDVQINHGFFFNEQTAIPMTKIQNVTLKAGPILQLVGLQTVSVETAADNYDIEAVLPETAENLKQQIMALTVKEDLEGANGHS